MRAAIDEAGGAISFADYMDLALFAPELGYYSAGTARFGADGSLSGSAGCNSYNGTFTAFDQTLRVGALTPSQVARWYQTERKMDAVIRADMAVTIPFNDLASRSGAEITRAYGQLPMLSLRLPEKALKGLAHNPNIDSISVDAPVSVMSSTVPSSASFSSMTVRPTRSSSQYSPSGSAGASIVAGESGARLPPVWTSVLVKPRDRPAQASLAPAARRRLPARAFAVRWPGRVRAWSSCT